MIRIEDFLFLENVEQSQAESLIGIYGNLSFDTSQEFRDFFESQGVRLVIKNVTESVIATDDTQVLLERLKNFKSSTDYDYVKKYIVREKLIEEAVQVGKIEVAKNEFDSLTKEELDPFFGFIVRKILTGNENGVLPSENLKAILDEQNRRNTEVNLDPTVPVERDSTGKIVSFKNYLKNRGFVSFDTTTERYMPRSFDYVVDKTFTSIPEAVDAERYVLEKAEEWATDINVSADEAVFLEKLKRLINEDSTSVPALETKIEKLQLQLNEAEEVQQNLTDTNDNLLEAIEQLSVEFNAKVAEVEVKDSQIITLNETIDSTLTDLGTSVTSQIENAADAFDSLSSKLEEQAKRAEEQAKAQLDAFKDGIGAIAAALQSSQVSGSNGTNTGSGGGSTNNQTGGGSNESESPLPITETEFNNRRQQSVDAIRNPKITIFTLRLVRDTLGIILDLGEAVEGSSYITDQEQLKIVRETKQRISNEVKDLKYNRTNVDKVSTIWVDLKEAGLISTTTSSGSGAGANTPNNDFLTEREERLRVAEILSIVSRNRIERNSLQLESLREISKIFKEFNGTTFSTESVLTVRDEFKGAFSEPDTSKVKSFREQIVSEIRKISIPNTDDRLLDKIWKFLTDLGLTSASTTGSGGSRGGGSGGSIRGQ
jgi:hypothetical protein